MKNPPSDESTSDTQEKVSVKDILQSVFAAALGVQSSKNRDRDFKQGNIGIFIAAGIIFTALFIGGVICRCTSSRVTQLTSHTTARVFPRRQHSSYAGMLPNHNATQPTTTQTIIAAANVSATPSDILLLDISNLLNNLF